MEKLISSFPKNIEDALKIAENSTFKPSETEIRNVVISGMGGSGIGGRLVAQWVKDEIKVPVQSHDDYNAPAFIDQHTLLIASSYSGNTEETISCVENAFQKGAQIIGICSGGELHQFCLKNKFDHVIVPGGNPPRTALAFSLVQVLSILSKLGLVNGTGLDAVERSCRLLIEELKTIQYEARELATFIHGTIPVFYSTNHYEGVAIRARQQFNENAKILCWHHVIPEMNHNELVGWGGGDERFSAIFFDTGDLIPRNRKRFELCIDIISKKTKTLVIKAKGTNRIEKSFYLIHLIDWASLYLSEIRGVDAIEIKVIDFLKQELANFNG